MGPRNSASLAFLGQECDLAQGFSPGKTSLLLYLIYTAEFSVCASRSRPGCIRAITCELLRRLGPELSSWVWGLCGGFASGLAAVLWPGTGLPRPC